MQASLGVESVSYIIRTGIDHHSSDWQSEWYDGQISVIIGYSTALNTFSASSLRAEARQTAVPGVGNATSYNIQYWYGRGID